jgi:hypothetical protein
MASEDEMTKQLATKQLPEAEGRGRTISDIRPTSITDAIPESVPGQRAPLHSAPPASGPRPRLAGEALTDFGYAVAVSRFEAGFVKATLIARPHRVLARLRISLETGRATTTVHAVAGEPTVEFRWWGPIELEAANRTLESSYQRATRPIPGGAGA